MRTAANYLIFSLATLLFAANPLCAEIPWQKNLRSAHAQAQAEGKLLLLHFYSDNCVWCDRLEKGSFKAPEVSSAIDQNFVPVKVHANSSPKLAQMFRVTKFPTDVIVTTDGTTLAHAVSPQDPNRYVAMLSQTLPALAEAKAKSSQPAAKIASGREENKTETPTPQPNTQAATNVDATSPGGTAPPASSDMLPSYAANPADSPASQTADSPSFMMPSANTGSVEAQFTGSRSDVGAFSMPGLDGSIPAASDEQEFGLPAPTDSESPLAAAGEQAVRESVPSDVQTNNVGSLSLDEQPELAMQGFCPVTVIREDRWVEGSPEFGVIHLGKLYLFTSNEKMETFLADPVPFTPVLNEIDVVRFFEERKIVPGKREWGLKDPVYNRMFFFADEAAMNHFYEHYGRYVDAAVEVMDKAVKEANPQQ